MSQLFGFPSGLSGGSKETEYTTNFNTNHSTSYPTNYNTSWNTSWSASSWSPRPHSATNGNEGYTGYVQYFTGSTPNNGFVGIWVLHYTSWQNIVHYKWHTGNSGDRAVLEGAVLQIMSGITVPNMHGAGSVYAKAGSPIDGWGAHPSGQGFPHNYQSIGSVKSYYWHVEVYQSTSHSHNTSRGTSKTTSKTTTYSTGQTTSHITYG
jgi:hypothetical protein